MKKILIIKLGALGDVIISTSLVKRIQEHHADSEIHLLTSPPFNELFNNFSELKVTSLPRKGVGSSFKMVCWIRKNKFDRVYDLQSNDRSRVILALSGIREKVGNHPAFPYTLSPMTKYKGETHIFARMNELLASAGITTAEDKPYIPALTADHEHVISWLKEENLSDKKLVLLHAGASPKHPEKCWPYYAELSQTLVELGFIPIWLGADNERNLNKKYASHCGIDATGLFSLTQLPLLAEQAAFSITNDSGPMHLLSASDRPVLAFFGPTNWRRNHALGQANYVITNQPEDIQGKKLLDDKYALKNISVKQVMDKLEKEGLLTN